MAFWQTLLDHLESGQAAFVGLVADHTAHSPGTRGAKILVRADGTTVGTIGGGIMEADIIERGVDAIQTAAVEAEVQTLYHREKGDGDKSGLGCAGHQTNVYVVCRPDRHRRVVSDIAERVRQDRAGLVQIDPSGLRMVDEGTIDRQRAPVRLVESGADWRYEEQLLNWKRAAIVGGGHCGLALSRVLANLGYAVTVFDTRPDVLTFAQNEWADQRIVVDDYADVGAQISHPELTHVVVMTKAQPSDVRALSGTIAGPYPYIGVMGSPAKIAQIKKDLVASGVDSAHVDKLTAPIGLDMTSNTPDEIAISVAAEFLRRRTELFPHTRPARPVAPADASS